MTNQPPAGSLRRLAVRGATWTVGGQVAAKVVALGSSMVVSRLLFEEAFATMGIVIFVAIMVQQLSDTGIYPALIRHPRGDEEAYVNTAWTIGVMRGVVLWIATAALAVPVANYYERPELVSLLLVTGSVAFLHGLRSTKMAVLQRKMNVAPQVLFDLAGQVIALPVTIVLAVQLRSVWALVIGWMTSTVVVTTLSHVAVRGHRARFRFDRDVANDIWTFGRWIFLSSLVSFFAMRLDAAVLPKLIPFVVFGVYQFALNLIEVPRMVNYQLSETVVYPALAETFRRGREDFDRGFGRVWGLAVPSVLLIVVGTCVAAPAFFVALYDERYAGAGWMTQLLMLTLWFEFMQILLGKALLALGKPHALFVNNVTRLAGTACGAVGGHALFGFPGFIVGFSVGPCLGCISLVRILSRSGVHVAARLAGATLLGIVACLALSGLPYLLIADKAIVPWITLGIGIVVVGPVALKLVPSLLRQFRGG